MEKYITYNKWTYYGRFLFIIPLIWLLFKPISNAASRSNDTLYILILIFFICFVLIIGLFIIVGLFFKPIGVTIEFLNNLLILKYIWKKPRQVEVSEIKGYSTTLLWTNGKNYKGLLLYLNDNKKIELTDYNIESHVPVLDFLKGSGVKCYGHEKSWFPFKPLFSYKYQNS